MDRVERWVRQKLAPAVAAGHGQWGTSSTAALGKVIYQVTDGTVAIELSERGFKYAGSTPVIACRYDDVEALELASLHEIMKLRGDLRGLLKISVVMRGASPPREMRWPLLIYSNIATVLERIVRELASPSEGRSFSANRDKKTARLLGQLNRE